MLELRPGCECCDCDLPPDSNEALICSFATKLGGICPNCGGELVPRPRRPADKLARYPATAVRTVKPHGCAPPA